MSFDDRGFMRNQSRYKTETSSREAHCQTGCNQYEKKPVMSGLLYEALFSTGESSQAPGNEGSLQVTVQQPDTLNWTTRSYPASSQADSSREWSSFSDISNAISPAASNDSVSWKTSESDTETLTEQVPSQTVNNFEVQPIELSPLPEQFASASPCTLQPGPGTEVEECRLNDPGAEVNEDSLPLKARNEDHEGNPQIPPTASFRVAQNPVLGHISVPEQGMTLNNECFTAAINERNRGDWRGKIMTKLKQMKAERRHENSYPNTTKDLDHHHQHEKEKEQQSQLDLQLQTPQCSSTLSPETTYLHTSVQCVSSSTMSLYVTPESPSGTSHSSDVSASSGKSYSKNYRYNQTAAALQKSGLLKTTVRTAELLQKNRVLQMELQKLRRETMVFMRSVLANPENEHLRKMYITQGVS